MLKVRYMENMKKAIIISCFNGWYNNRLKPIIKYFEDREYQVKCFFSDFDHIKKEYIDMLDTNNCYYIHVPAYRSNVSFKRILSHLAFGNKINQIIKKEKPDLIYLLVPPNITAKYCGEYKKKYPQTKLILDIIDLWPESFPFKLLRKNIFFKVWKNMRNNAIKVSDLIFTECQYYQKLLNDELKNFNSYNLSLFKDQYIEDQKLVLDIINNKINKDKILKFAYLGSMNSILDIETITKVINFFILKGNKCELHAVGDGEKRTQFEATIRGTGCDTYFYGIIFDEKSKIKILSPCDFGLNIMKDISVGLTLKSIEYFSYGLPIINNIKGDTWELVNEEEIGVNVPNNFNELSLNFNYSHNKVLELFKKNFSKESFTKQLNYAFKENYV